MLRLGDKVVIPGKKCINVNELGSPGIETTIVEMKCFGDSMSTAIPGNVIGLRLGNK